MRFRGARGWHSAWLMHCASVSQVHALLALTSRPLGPPPTFEGLLGRLAQRLAGGASSSLAPSPPAPRPSDAGGQQLTGTSPAPACAGPAGDSQQTEFQVRVWQFACVPVSWRGGHVTSARITALVPPQVVQQQVAQLQQALQALLTTPQRHHHDAPLHALDANALRAHGPAPQAGRRPSYPSAPAAPPRAHRGSAAAGALQRAWSLVPFEDDPLQAMREALGLDPAPSDAHPTPGVCLGHGVRAAWGLLGPPSACVTRLVTRFLCARRRPAPLCPRSPRHGGAP